MLLVLLQPPVLGALLASADLRCDPVEVVGTCLAGVVLHDLHFFAIHTLLHKVKLLYTR